MKVIDLKNNLVLNTKFLPTGINIEDIEGAMSIYDNKYNKQHRIKFTEIDDALFDTIVMLNNKGYKTIACCSGHFGKPGAYIYFKDSIFKDTKIAELLDKTGEETSDSIFLDTNGELNAIYLRHTGKEDRLEAFKMSCTFCEIMYKFAQALKKENNNTIVEIEGV